MIIKVDENGNIKAMARGLAPVIVQGCSDSTSKCISKQLATQNGHLKTLRERLKGITDQQRVAKVFYFFAVVRTFDKKITGADFSIFANVKSPKTVTLARLPISPATVPDEFHYWNFLTLWPAFLFSCFVEYEVSVLSTVAGAKSRAALQ